MSEKLNKCGCGGSARTNAVRTTHEPIYWYVQCISCGCKVAGLTEESAAAAWNTAHPKAIRLDDVREMVEDCKGNSGCAGCPHDILCDCFCSITDCTVDKLAAYLGRKNG